MAIRNLRFEGDPILLKKSREVEVFDDNLKQLAEDMMDTMHKYDGVGLAAVQVGILKRLIVIDLGEDQGSFVLVNPKIVKTKGEQECDEGCLSFPNKFGKVIRPVEVTVEAQNLEGKRIRLRGKDLLAQALCHEIDHLDGIVFTTKVESGTVEEYDPKTKTSRPLSDPNVIQKENIKLFLKYIAMIQYQMINSKITLISQSLTKMAVFII